MNPFVNDTDVMLLLIKCPDSFLNIFKASEDWGVCLNPVRDNSKKERTWRPG